MVTGPGSYWGVGLFFFIPFLFVSSPSIPSWSSLCVGGGLCKSGIMAGGYWVFIRLCSRRRRVRVTGIFFFFLIAFLSEGLGVPCLGYPYAVLMSLALRKHELLDELPNRFSLPRLLSSRDLHLPPPPSRPHHEHLRLRPLMNEPFYIKKIPCRRDSSCCALSISRQSRKAVRRFDPSRVCFSLVRRMSSTRRLREDLSWGRHGNAAWRWGMIVWTP